MCFSYSKTIKYRYNGSHNYVLLDIELKTWAVWCYNVSGSGALDSIVYYSLLYSILKTNLIKHFNIVTKGCERAKIEPLSFNYFIFKKHDEQECL